MIEQTKLCHAQGMVPVDAGTILHVFAYLRTPRPQLYRLSEWPQLFILCKNCGDLDSPNRDAYEPISWEQALEWAQER